MALERILLVAGAGSAAEEPVDWASWLATLHQAALTVVEVGGASDAPPAAPMRGRRMLGQPALDAAWLAPLAAEVDLIAIADQLIADKHAMDLVEQVAADSGRAVVVLPRHLPPGRVARRIATAWNGSGPARRALRAAMPLLRRAEAVAIITVGERPVDLAVQLQRYLEREHHVLASSEPVIGSDRDAGQLIARRVEKLDIDLLVMGAWSRPRLHEMMFGSATRHLLGGLGIPVLVSA